LESCAPITPAWSERWISKIAEDSRGAGMVSYALFYDAQGPLRRRNALPRSDVEVRA
jgi:hypothetical protein